MGMALVGRGATNPYSAQTTTHADGKSNKEKSSAEKDLYKLFQRDPQYGGDAEQLIQDLHAGVTSSGPKAGLVKVPPSVAHVLRSFSEQQCQVFVLWLRSLDPPVHTLRLPARMALSNELVNALEIAP